MANPRLVYVLLAIVLITVFTSATNGNAISIEKRTTAKPGVGVLVTKAGLSYATQRVYAKIMNKLKSMTIPDNSGIVLGGIFSYNVTGIKLSHLATGRNKLLFKAGSGVTWNLSKLGFNLDANITVYLYKKWYEWNAGMSVVVDNGSLTFPIVFGADAKGGPTLTVSCVAGDQGSWVVNFTGSSTKAFCLFKSYITKRIRSEICSAVSSYVNKEAAEYLSSYPVLQDIGSTFQVDYGFLGAPSYNVSSVAFPLRGEVFVKKQRTKSSVSVPDLPPLSEMTRDIYFLLTDYVFNSMTDAAFRQGLLDKNITSKDLPPDQSYFLNTTCPGNLCLGKLIAQTATLYPNSQAEMRTKSSKAPSMAISPSSVTVSFAADADFYVNQPSKSPVFMFSVRGSLNTVLHILSDEVTSARKVTAAISQTSLSVTLQDTKIGAISANLLKTLVDTIVNLYIRPQLNKLGAVGVPLPDFGNKTLYIKPQITLSENTVIVEVGLKKPGKASPKPHEDLTLYENNVDQSKMSFQVVNGHPVKHNHL